MVLFLSLVMIQKLLWTKLPLNKRTTTEVSLFWESTFMNTIKKTERHLWFHLKSRSEIWVWLKGKNMEKQID